MVVGIFPSVWLFLPLLPHIQLALNLKISLVIRLWSRPLTWPLTILNIMRNLLNFWIPVMGLQKIANTLTRGMMATSFRMRMGGSTLMVSQECWRLVVKMLCGHALHKMHAVHVPGMWHALYAVCLVCGMSGMQYTWYVVCLICGVPGMWYGMSA